MEPNFLARTVFLVALISSVLATKAQQEIINVDRYQTQLPMLNPALSGMWANELAVGARWTSGVVQQPAMPIIRVDGYSPVLNSGFGISVTGTANKRGSEDIYIRGNYNYQYQLKNNAKLSGGVVLEFGRIETIARQISEGSAGIGFAYAAQNWHIGIAAQQLIAIYNQSTKRRQNPIYVATGNYIFRLRKDFGLQPEGMLGFDENNNQALFNVGFKTTYRLIYLGLHYIKDNQLFFDVDTRFGVSTGMVIFKIINLDYAYSTRENQTGRNTLTLRLFIAPNKNDK